MQRRAVLSGWISTLFSELESYPVDRHVARKELDEREAAWGVIRSWCGARALDTFDESTALQKENERLRSLLDGTARWLKEAGHPVKAAHLQRQGRHEQDP